VKNEIWTSPDAVQCVFLVSEALGQVHNTS
jgi:hypothetical protein